MQIDALYYLYRLNELLESFSQNDEKSFGELYKKIEDSTAPEILEQIPQDICAAAAVLSIEQSEQNINELKNALAPYAKEAAALLPSLQEANEQFTAALKEEFCENGYFLKGGVFRKIRGKHLFIIEAELVADFAATENGKVTGICVRPLVRIADTKVRRTKDGSYRTESGMLDDDTTVFDVKHSGVKAFYKTLKHLSDCEIAIGESLSDEAVKEMADSCTVASAVCENRAIPSEYKRLCKNDVPFSKALTLAAMLSLVFFVVLTILLGLIAGIVVWLSFGFTRFYGMFLVPYYYLFTLLAAVVYGAVCFKRIRSGRF